MKVHQALFLKSAVKAADYPRGGLPEIAFMGRSNVGKSSLINCLLNRRGIAQTSRTPGKTRTLNFFTINDSLLFVDLPGYGYAKTARSVRAGWKGMIEGYLGRREALCGSVLLVDARHPPSPLDSQMMQYISHIACPAVVVATKADKLGSAAKNKSLDLLRQELPVGDGVESLLFSSRTGFGKDRLWGILDSFARG